MADEDVEFAEWNRICSNGMTKLARDLDEALKWAPEGHDTKPYSSLSSFLRQEAETLNPDSLPYPKGENVIQGPWRVVR